MSKWLWLIVFLFGLLFLFLVPPFQKNDETAHFYRTLALRSGSLVCSQGYYSINKSWGDFVTLFDFSEVLRGKNYSFNDHLSGALERTSDKVKISGLCGLSPYGYGPNVLGLVIGSVFTQNNYWLFMSGRLAGFIFFLVCGYFCIRTIGPESRKILWGFMLTPMVLSSVTGYTYDVVLLSLLMVVFTTVMNLIGGKGYRYSFFGWIALAIICVIKVVYLPLFGILLVLNFPKAKRITIFYFVLSLLFCFGSMKLLNRSNITNNYSLFSNPSLQARLILADPYYFFKVFIDTISNSWFDYFRGMVGVFGWSVVNLRFQSSYFLYLVGLIWVVATFPKKILSKISVKLLITIILGIIVSIVCVMVAMYLFSSVIAEDKIVGVQGRYFLPLLPFVVLVMAKVWRGLLNHPIFIKLFLGLVVLILIVSSGLGLYQRYYDPARLAYLYLKPELSPTGVLVNPEMSWMVVDKPYAFKTDVSTQKYIVGFQIGLGSKDKAVNIPYRLEIKDKQCIRTLNSLYLRQFDIQREVVYKQLLNAFKSPENQLCVVVTPMTLGIKYDDSFLSLRKINERIDWQWLYEDKGAYLKL